ncbi:MAG TPA: UV DNA damage repair endonuclease UvsE [Acidobacteriota bacterium]|nr:UV DNA damage repair endonuclease UvsE [Acidobacteriota bacterium]HQF86659.1 UV DNA damage repair endonuclease UvsE [Acidobacteriota bacterium]HQG90089.1 UV DNA damage repair endonuclease UvsE [Acidobacteriota bacterium]HQK86792.1 UV DNA damage repair endonuclease UvsE [Acidobacteriota bacterium]
MRIGYPCINRSIPPARVRTFRLASYSSSRLRETVAANLDFLAAMVRYNIRHGLGFLRISSDLVPFASHPVCVDDWGGAFRERFAEIGRMIRDNRMRISMHPDQFTLINAQEPEIVRRSVRELEYHVRVLELLELDDAAKVQVHVGGVYGDRAESLARFARNWARLPAAVRRRLVVENDDRNYPVSDCLELHVRCGIPVLFDTFHHAIRNRGEPMAGALAAAARTWSASDGPPMVDYSSQAPDARPGTHSHSLDAADFQTFLRDTRPYDFDLMLEIKDKERSALRALALAVGDPRLQPAAGLRFEPDGGQPSIP